MGATEELQMCHLSPLSFFLLCAAFLLIWHTYLFGHADGAC